jgi:hypothetical protein
MSVPIMMRISSVGGDGVGWIPMKSGQLQVVLHPAFLMESANLESYAIWYLDETGRCHICMHNSEFSFSKMNLCIDDNAATQFG